MDPWLSATPLPGLWLFLKQDACNAGVSPTLNRFEIPVTSFSLGFLEPVAVR